MGNYYVARLTSIMKEQAKLCKDFLKNYKKFQKTSPANVDHCLNQAIKIYRSLCSTKEMVKVGERDVTEKDYEKFIKVLKELQQNCLAAFAEAGVNTSSFR